MDPKSNAVLKSAHRYNLVHKFLLRAFTGLAALTAIFSLSSTDLKETLRTYYFDDPSFWMEIATYAFFAIAATLVLTFIGFYLFRMKRTDSVIRAIFYKIDNKIELDSYDKDYMMHVSKIKNNQKKHFILDCALPLAGIAFFLSLYTVYFINFSISRYATDEIFLYALEVFIASGFFSVIFICSSVIQFKRFPSDSELKLIEYTDCI
jgi:hypothetical protein